MFRICHSISCDFRSRGQHLVNEPSSTLPVEPHSVGRSTFKPGAHRKQKSRMVSFRMDEDDFSRLDTFAQQTSCSRAEVLRRCLRTARLESTADAQARSVSSNRHQLGHRLRWPRHRRGQPSHPTYSEVNVGGVVGGVVGKNRRTGIHDAHRPQ